MKHPLALVAALLLSGCAGRIRPSVPAPQERLSGSWSVKKLVIMATAGCADERGKRASYELVIRRDGDGLSLEAPWGRERETFRGKPRGKEVRFNGVYSDRGGRTKEAFIFTFGADRLTGTSGWTWWDVDAECSGRSSWSGSKTGSPPETSNPTP